MKILMIFVVLYSEGLISSEFEKVKFGKPLQIKEQDMVILKIVEFIRYFEKGEIEKALSLCTKGVDISIIDKSKELKVNELKVLKEKKKLMEIVLPVGGKKILFKIKKIGENWKIFEIVKYNVKIKERNGKD